MAEMTRSTTMTAEEFFELPETNLPVELIDGEVITSPVPFPKHQRVIGDCYLVMRSLIPDGEVFLSLIDVHLDGSNVVQPDLVWVSAVGRCKIGEKRLEGAPDLVVEVFSAGTTRRDRREKYALYERFGVREYWMIDPHERYVEVVVLVEERFVRQGVYGPEESFVSSVLGVKTVALNTIFS